MVTPFNGPPGKLGSTQAHFRHHIDGEEFRHEADQIDLNPDLVIGTTTVTNVQDALGATADSIELLLNSQGFVAIGDGYDTYHASEETPDTPYDALIPSINGILYDILNDTSHPAHHRIRDGGIILLKAGTYVVDDTIDIPPGITIIGEGYGTKIINTTSPPSPLFRIKADLMRTADKAIESSKPFIFSRSTTFYNLTIADNFIIPRFLGDLAYKVPQNTDSSAPLIIVEAGAHFVCENVKMLGHVQYTGPTLASLTALPFAIDGSTPSTTGTILNIHHCDVDGFSQAVEFITNDAGVTSTKDDYLYLKNNKIRVYGFLDGYVSPSDYTHNSFFVMNSANADISNNYLYGADSGYINTVLYVSDFQAGLDTNAFGRINISNNHGAINKTGSSFSADENIVRLNGTPDGIYLNIGFNNFDNSALKFGDLNTAQSAKTTSAYSSSTSANGDNILRTAEITTSVPTIIQAINARPTITVGDGYISFGDINGDDAINVAMNRIISTGFSGKVIVKKGTYTLTAGIGSIVIRGDIEIEGLNAVGCVIESADGTDLFSLIAGAKLSLSNLTLNGKVPIVDGTCHIQDCIFDGYTDQPCVLLEAGDGNTYRHFIFDRCTFSNIDNSPCVLIQPTNGGTTSTIAGIYFNECIFNLGSTQKVANNFFGNSGIIDISTNGQTDILFFPVFNVDDIHLINCRAYYRTIGVEGNILHFIPTSNGTDYGGAGTPFVMINNFEINGGEYIIKASISYTLSPFTIVLPNFMTGTKISIRNVVLGTDGIGVSSSGGKTVDTDYWFGSVAIADWAFCVLFADIVEVENVKFKNLSQLSDSGDLFIESREICAKNIHIGNYIVDGAGGVPNHRIFINGGGIVEDVVLLGETATVATDWVGTTNSGLIKLQSDGYEFKASVNSARELVLKNATMSDFRYNTTSYAGNGIRISNVNKGAVVNINDMTIDSCNVYNTVKGIVYESNSATTQRVSNLKINDCIVNSAAASSLGIYFFNVTAAGSAPFNKLSLFDNKVDCTSTGMFLRSDFWASGGYISIMGNKVNSSNPAIDVLDGVGGDQSNIHGIIMGNDCGAGQITVRATGSLGSGNFTAAAFPIRGCETGYPGSADTRTLTDGNAMFHNIAILKLS